MEIEKLEWEKRRELQKAIADLDYSPQEAEKIFNQFEDHNYIEMVAPKEEEFMLE